MKIEYASDGNELFECEPFAKIDDFSLTGLVILTGVNGVGKTKFLKHLQSLFPVNRRSFGVQVMIPAGGPSFSFRESLPVTLDLPLPETFIWNIVMRFVPTLKKRIDNLRAVSPTFDQLYVSNPSDERFLDNREVHAMVHQDIPETLETTVEQHKKESLFERYHSYTDIAHDIETGAGLTKPEAGFYQYLDKRVIEDLVKRGAFGHKLSDEQLAKARMEMASDKSVETIFQDYLANRQAKYLEQYRESQANGGNFEVESIRVKTSPWTTFNQALEAYGSRYTIRIPTSPELNFDPNGADARGNLYQIIKFKDKVSGQEVPFNELSRGEQVLMNIIVQNVNGLSGFHGKHDKNTDAEKKLARQWRQLPSVFRLDEPDAHLDPTSTKKLLTYLRNELVEKQGHIVIMTSHALSTLAMAEDGELHILEEAGPPNKNGRHVRIRQASHTEAVRILNSELDTLEVGFRNEHFVFVEHESDQKLYELLHANLNRDPAKQIALKFIGTGLKKDDGEGSKGSGCTIVKDLARSLSNNSNTFGLIDRDESNVASENVHVLGQGEVYAIENLLLDPLLIASAAIKLHDTRGEKFFSDIGHDNILEISQICQMSTDEKQHLSDRVQAHLFTEVCDDEKTLRHYNGGFELRVSKRLLEMNGHDLETLVREKHRNFVSFENEGGLLNKICSQGIASLASPLFPLALHQTFCDLEEGKRF